MNQDACDLMELFREKTLLEKIREYELRQLQRDRAEMVVEALKKVKRDV